MMIDDQDLAGDALVEHVSTQKMLARLSNVGVGPERDAVVPVRSQHVVRHDSVARDEMMAMPAFSLPSQMLPRSET